MGGNIADALEMLDKDYANGADPILVIQDLLEIIHWLSRIKVTPQVADGPSVPETDRERGKDITKRLSMGALTRAWQMLLKGLLEAQSAPSPIQSAEMILIRLAYLADLPTPADAVKAISKESSQSGPQNPSPSSAVLEPANPRSNAGQVVQAKTTAVLQVEHVSEVQPGVDPLAQKLPNPQTFEEVISLADQMNERILRANLVSNIRLVRFEPGAIVFQPIDNLPREFSHDLTRFLNDATDRRWVVTVSFDEQGSETIQEREDEASTVQLKEIAQTPFMRSVLQVFPGTQISEVRDIGSVPEMLEVISDDGENQIKDILGEGDE
jgi:DNA polymerase-3 subunit gamma/tau